MADQWDESKALRDSIGLLHGASEAVACYLLFEALREQGLSYEETSKKLEDAFLMSRSSIVRRINEGERLVKIFQQQGYNIPDGAAIRGLISSEGPNAK